MRDTPGEADTDVDVLIVGGGPAGCAAGVFTARYGLETTIFDKGSAALPRCAYLENYLGFPGGIDVDVFQDLMHAHVREVGCRLREEMVSSVSERPAGAGFDVETQGGDEYTTQYLIGAAWYDGSYLRGLDRDEMFEEHEHHGEMEERFDPGYPDEDGRTDIDGLYVAAPGGSRSAQAITSAGHGAHVARSLIEDLRRQAGFAGHVAPEYDWLRSEVEFAGEWGDRDRWREWVDNELADADISEDRQETLRERYIERAFDTHRSDAEVEDLAEDGLQRLVETIGEQRILDVIDDAAIDRHRTQHPPNRNE